SGPALKLLRERGVGVVLVGMGTIDAMEPKGQLHLGMKEKLLHTKDPRYSPAWIWGMSQMRGLTAATAEPAFFQPDKVVSTGGSKRGIATAAAGIHDNRFTGIVPVVAPPLGNPGTPAAIIGTEPSWINGVDAAFLNSVDPGVRKSLEDRRDRREDTRLTLSEVNQQRWKPAEVKELSQILWNASRITAYLDEVNRRGLEYFYCVGTNDSVTPALLQLGRKYPDFPVYIVPGGQHGGPRDAGFTRHVTDEPGVVQNFESFCLHHFFGLRGLPDTPQISAEMKDGYLVVRTLYEGSSPLKENLLSWSYDRHAPYCLPFEYDKWESTEMQAEDHNTYSARIPLPAKVLSIQFLSTHVDWENGIPFFVSSPLSERKVFP
ncbi:MAG: hypothetical protein KJT03_09275, partial [Verrucomicrobiae bacterium]|nr:hypothetical protein [Verrucomicrobiae bacterium]